MILVADFGIPGGKIEIDESSEEAVIRELNEELDIVVHKPKKVMQYLHRFKNLIYDIHFFEVISFKGSIKTKFMMNLNGQILPLLIITISYLVIC